MSTTINDSSHLITPNLDDLSISESPSKEIKELIISTLPYHDEIIHIKKRLKD